MDTDTRKALIDKIRKCLALAKSANEHEAAAALAKAQALMAEHGIGLGDVEFGEATARGNGCARKPPLWEAGLLTAVRYVFPCSAILDGGKYRFIGRVPSAELAAYAFTVLHRQLKAARADYIRTKLKRVRPGRKSARADIFCEGWATTILTKLRAIAPQQREPDVELQDYVRDRFNLVTLTPREGKVRGGGHGDYWNGVSAGRDADLHRPMGAASVQQLIGPSA